MKYAVRINKKITYVKNYRVLKRVSGSNANFITRMVINFINKKREEEERANL